ncbi:MAG: cell division protein FtsH, partial [Cloacibacillus sp.]
ALVDGSMNKAHEILTENRERLELITKLLLEKEILEGDELDELLGYPKKEHAAPQENSAEAAKPEKDKEPDAEDKKDKEP